MNTELLLQIGGVSIPVGAAVIYLAKRAVETVLAQHREINSLRMGALSSRIDELQEELKEFRGVLRSEILPKLDSMRDAMVRNSGRMDAMKETLEKHASAIEVALPAIKSEIGKLSMYYKTKGGT